MVFLREIDSPLGVLTAVSDGEAVTGLYLPGQKYFPAGVTASAETGDPPVFRALEEYLTLYFAGKDPGQPPPLAPHGTAYRLRVWEALRAIPYGRTATYGDLARRAGGSPRSIGGAVGHNPISILIPCHRVIGSDGGLTGYAGGIAAKRFLLALEAASQPRPNGSQGPAV